MRAPNTLTISFENADKQDLYKIVPRKKLKYFWIIKLQIKV